VRFVGDQVGVGAPERATLARYGATVRFEFPEIHAVAITMDAAQRAALSSDPVVRYVEDDALKFADQLAARELVPARTNGLFGIVDTRAHEVHSHNVWGQGINVGVADTGVDYTHPDLSPVYQGGVDMMDNDNDPWWAFNAQETHATHVSGTIVAASNDVGVMGVAPRANLFVARVLASRNGERASGPTSAVMAGVRWLVLNAGCRVVNLSLGSASPPVATEDAFYRDLYQRGALIVASSGNDSRSSIGTPAAYPTNIAVGAIDVAGNLASFSNTGTNLDVVAPGVNVLSSFPRSQGSEAVVRGIEGYPSVGLTFAGRTTGVSGRLVSCGEGASGACGAGIFGGIALIRRGGSPVNFSEKVANAMAQGAIAAVIVNNVSGAFSGSLTTSTAPGNVPWIPVLAVSDTDGAALATQIDTVIRVENRVSDWALNSGTSMAAPHVAGVVALLWSLEPTLRNEALERILLETSRDLGPRGYDTTFGFGAVDAYAAASRVVR
jgi:subtilisin family serine protease